MLHGQNYPVKHDKDVAIFEKVYLDLSLLVDSLEN